MLGMKRKTTFIYALTWKRAKNESALRAPFSALLVDRCRLDLLRLVLWVSHERPCNARRPL